MVFFGSTVLRCWLVVALLLFAGTAPGKPITLSQPFDLNGKRVIVVAVMGNLAATTQTRTVLGTTVGFKQRFFRPDPPLELDPAVAREAAAALEKLGATAQIVALQYRDEDLYRVDTMERGGKLSAFKDAQRDAWAFSLLRQHAADALLFVHAGERYFGRYSPPSRNYGVYFPSDQAGSSYVHMVQALYVRDLDRPLVFHGATGRAPAGLQIPAAAAGADAEPELSAAQWVALRPSLELAAARATRALLDNIHQRALSPRTRATERRKFAPPAEEDVTIWPY